MKFKAKTKVWYEGPKRDKPIVFTFTKRRILFPKDIQGQILNLGLPEGCPFTHGSDYILDVGNDENEVKQYRLKFNRYCTEALTINWYNRIKADYIHKRYWFQKEGDFIKKAIFTGLVSLIIGTATATIAGVICYNLGYANGLKAARQQTNTSAPKSISNPNDSTTAVPMKSIKTPTH